LVGRIVGEVSGRQTLIHANTDSLLAGQTEFVELYDFGNTIPQNFVFSEDGRYLYGSSYFTGVSNVFRYDLALDSMDAMSNAETGFSGRSGGRRFPDRIPVHGARLHSGED